LRGGTRGLAGRGLSPNKHDLDCRKPFLISSFREEEWSAAHAAAAEKISTFLGLATSPRHNENTTVQPAIIHNRVDRVCALLRTRMDTSGRIDERLTTIIDVKREMFFYE
jgi:hypothetical protein